MSELPDYSRSRAILIGTGTYRSEDLPPLPAAANSLTGMREVLIDRKLCGWPRERVTTLLDPTGMAAVVQELRRLARETEDVLLVYFVGHGLILPRGQLCLTLTDTLPAHADVTGLDYARIREALLDSRARVKIVILDCCYAGRANEALAPAATIGGTTRIRGAYTLTASDQAAHVVPLAEQAKTATSFTRELLGLIREGVPDAPEWLTLGDLYPHLRGRLEQLGLPDPDQRNSDTAALFGFTRNAAHRPTPRSPYAVRLTELLAGWGVTAVQLAEAMGEPAEAVTAYLLGKRVAPGEFLDGFLDLLDAHGHGPDEQARAALHALRREAQRTSPLAAERIAHLEETIRELRLLVGNVNRQLAAEQRTRVTERALAAGEVARIAGLLAAAEEARRLLRDESEEQGPAPELEDSQANIDVATRDLRLLREQVRTLMDSAQTGPAGAVMGEARALLAGADDQEGLVVLLERALELAPGDAGLRRELASAYAQWARKINNEVKDYPRALGLLRRSLDLAPGDPTALGFLEATLGNRADQLCRPGSPEGDLEEAAGLWEELIALRPGLDDYADGYAHTMRLLARSAALADRREAALSRMAAALSADRRFPGEAALEAPRRVAVMLADHAADDLRDRPFPERAEVLGRARSYDDGEDIRRVLVSLWRAEAAERYTARRYEDAAGLLEEALRVARSARARATLRRELGVVYSSHAVACTNGRDMVRARALIDRAVECSPDDEELGELRKKIASLP
ncbi:caspase family protein [Kitasatospora sp. NPDC051170]|uniref:caspase, EACC1-associated type n=1 Tax=Kitasatospora sp. NPDC051170 TaxID=3364056 RepID=UPI003790A985